MLEAGHMTWDGSTSGCSAYYFLTTWLMGLANYLGTESDLSAVENGSDEIRTCVHCTVTDEQYCRERYI